MSTHPEVLWAQRSSESDAEKNVIYLTVNLPEINEPTLKLDLQPKEIHFETKAGRPEVKDYKFDLKLYGEIDPEKSTRKLSTRSLILVLHKKELKHEYWPRLTEEKRIPFVKTDFGKWVDEDEQDGTGLDDDLGGMGGMGGMGGGMDDMDFGGGGMGGAGGMDFEKMMANIKANKSGEGPEGVDPADSDSDDDEGPPPLEDAEEPKKPEEEAGPSGSSS